MFTISQRWKKNANKNETVKMKQIKKNEKMQNIKKQ